MASDCFRRFFIRYNVIYLGLLCLALLFVHASLIIATIKYGYWTKWEWGMLFETARLALWAIAFMSWSYGLFRTWYLTRDSQIFNKTRLWSFAFLIGIPALLLHARVPLISMIVYFVGTRTP